MDVFAFMDEGSSLTMMDEDLLDRLGDDGDKIPLCLRWTGGTCRDEPDSRKISIKIRKGLGAPMFNLQDVRTVKNLRLLAQSLDVHELKDKYEHLRGLPIESYNEATPKILIGIDNYDLSVPIDIREGGREEPVATKTRLGWALGGVKGTREDNDVVIHHSFHACKCDHDTNVAEQKLDDLAQKFFEQEQYGVEKFQTVVSVVSKHLGNHHDKSWKSLPNRIVVAI